METKSLQEKLEGTQGLEEKIHLCLATMKEALDTSPERGAPVPRFKQFWEAREHCLNLFKQVPSSVARARLWSEYIALTEEVHQLRAILEHESKFAVEQLELATASLEQEIAEKEKHLAACSSRLSSRLSSSEILRSKQTQYDLLEKELFLIGNWASRVVALRKEILTTEMRMRDKNRFLARLSKVGDLIFPRKKELQKSLTEGFKKDIEQLVKSGGGNLRELRIFQSLAKEMLFDAASFKAARESMNGLWQKLSSEQKEKTVKMQKSMELVRGKILVLKEKCAKEGVSDDEVQKLGREIAQMMRSLDLGPSEERLLKGEIQEAKAPLFAREKAAGDEKRRLLEGALRDRQQLILQVKKSVEELSAKAPEMTVLEIAAARLQIEKELADLTPTAAERQEIEPYFEGMRRLVFERENEKLRALLAQKGPSAEEVSVLLRDFLELKRQVKEEIDVHRKVLSRSNLDLGQSLRYQELCAEGKERLQEIEAAVESLEDALES